MARFHPRYPGKLFPKGDIKGMFSYGVGGMMWTEDEDGSDTLDVLMPTRKGSKLHRFRTDRDGWDEKPLEPTFGREVRISMGWFARVVGGAIVVYPGEA